jgi:hypothetical protein
MNLWQKTEADLRRTKLTDIKKQPIQMLRS